MKKHFLLLLSTLLTTQIVTAEEMKLGVGVALSGNSAIVKMPVNLQNDLRLEPEIGFQSINSSGTTRNTFRVGSGLYLMKKTAQEISIYFGPKLLIGAGDYNIGSPYKHELSGVMGAEYFIHSLVSIGAEVSLGVGFGNTHGVSTNTQTNLRFYF